MRLGLLKLVTSTPMKTNHRREKMSWKPIKTFKKDPGAFPNELVLLLVKHTVKKTRNSDAGTVADVAEGQLYVTMGNWNPEMEETNDKEKGMWVAVGWNWDSDYFTELDDVDPVGWQKLPKAKM
jgi:hypothetical protein